MDFHAFIAAIKAYAPSLPVQEVVAGFFGALVSLFVSPAAGFWQTICRVLTGVVAAAYLTSTIDLMLDRLTGSDIDKGVSGFLVGLAAMEIVRGIQTAAAERAARLAGLDKLPEKQSEKTRDE